MTDITLAMMVHNGELRSSVINKNDFYVEWSELPRKQQIQLLRSIREWYDSHENILNER